MNKRWTACELNKKDAEKFRTFCKGKSIKYEASEADNLIHFEVYVSQLEERDCNDFLRFL